MFLDTSTYLGCVEDDIFKILEKCVPSVIKQLAVGYLLLHSESGSESVAFTISVELRGWYIIAGRPNMAGTSRGENYGSIGIQGHKVVEVFVTPKIEKTNMQGI